MQRVPFSKSLIMNALSKVFTGLRKGLEMLDKATKVLKSVEIISQNLKNTIDELENVWGKPEHKEEGAAI